MLHWQYEFRKLLTTCARFLDAMAIFVHSFLPSENLYGLHERYDHVDLTIDAPFALPTPKNECRT